MLPAFINKVFFRAQTWSFVFILPITIFFYYDHKIICYVVSHGKHLPIPDLNTVPNFFILSDILSFLLYSVKNCMLSWFLHLFYFWSQNSVNIFLFKVCHILFFCFFFILITLVHIIIIKVLQLIPLLLHLPSCPSSDALLLIFLTSQNHLSFKTLRGTHKTISQIYLIT